VRDSTFLIRSNSYGKTLKVIWKLNEGSSHQSLNS
jgi:hypothetical protein